jgi:hypothetical protein
MFMKTKLILLIALVAVLFSFATISNENSKKHTATIKPSNTSNSKGLVMEDRDQFN